MTATDSGCSSFVVGLNSTAITAAAGAINARFNVSDVAFTNSYWPITAWNLSGAFTGLLVLPAMEHFGIRWIYLVRSSSQHGEATLP